MHGAVVKTCYCSMPKYNELMALAPNLNLLLAWLMAPRSSKPWLNDPSPGLLEPASNNPGTQN